MINTLSNHYPEPPRPDSTDSEKNEQIPTDSEKNEQSTR